MLPHLPGDVCQYLVAVFELDTKHGVWQRFHHHSFDFDRFFFGRDTLPEEGNGLEIVKADIRSLDEVVFKGVDAVIDLAAIAIAAEQMGGSQQILDLTVAYTRERVQFNRPIASFQAVKHQAAVTATSMPRVSGSTGSLRTSRGLSRTIS